MTEPEPLILSALPDAVIAFDDAARITFANPAADRLFGYEPGALVGRPLRDVLPAGGPPPGTKTIEGLEAGGTARLLVATRVAAGPLGVVTLRHAATESFTRSPLYTLFKNLPVALSLQRGPELVWELANPAFRGLLAGIEVVGKRMRDVLPDYARMARVAREVFATGVPFAASELPLRIVTTPGQPMEIRYFTAIVEPTRLGGGAVDGVFMVAMDVSSLIESRRAAESLATRREGEVKERDDFISIAAHELRTPLTTLSIAVERLSREAARPPRVAQREAEEGAESEERLASHVPFLERQVKRMARLVETLLDVSRFAKGELVLRKNQVDLGVVLAEVVERHRHDAERAGCPLTIELPRGVVGLWDPLRVEQVATNLLLNAIRYGPGRPIEVSLEDAGLEARFWVRDHGIGISDTDQARIFGRFERAVEPGSYGGLGLGLWIVREIVERHGGRIELESVPGEGSKFTIVLPKEC